jgi:hypothetical protein
LWRKQSLRALCVAIAQRLGSEPEGSPGPEMNHALRVAAVSLIRERPDLCQFWPRRGFAQGVRPYNAHGRVLPAVRQNRVGHLLQRFATDGFTRCREVAERDRRRQK